MATAIEIHVVYTDVKNYNTTTGKVVLKDDSTLINELLHTQQRVVVVPDGSVPNSAGWPLIDAYLKLEAASGFVLGHLSQTMIVTYSQHDLNAA